MNYRAAVYFFALIAICVPQLIVAVPEITEQIKTPDLFAVMTVPLALLAYLNRNTMNAVQLAAFAMIAFTVAVVSCNIFQSSDRRLYQDNLPHLARLYSIHSLLFLIVAMPKNIHSLRRTIIAFGCLATLASVTMAILYHFGSSTFDAHQTFERTSGTLNHRLGGLAGESGAFAFNATTGFQFMLVGLAMGNMKRSYQFCLWIVFPLFTALIYHESLVRVALLNSILFFIICIAIVNHSATKSRLLIVLTVLSAGTIFLMLSAAGHPLVDFEVDRMSFDGDANRLSSGRLAHWVEAFEVWSTDPVWILFGMGHRASEFIVMHPIENVFLFHLLNYGIIGSSIFMSLYGLIFLPIIRRSLQGDFASGVFSALVLSVFVQWQVNDVNLYFQTFPVLLFFAGWYSHLIRTETLYEPLGAGTHAVMRLSY